MSLARRSRRLRTLDLSWCRNLTDEAMGVIVDSCLSLRVLKLFGCTQVSIWKQSLCGDANFLKIISSFLTSLLSVLKFLEP